MGPKRLKPPDGSVAWPGTVNRPSNATHAVRATEALTENRLCVLGHGPRDCSFWLHLPSTTVRRLQQDSGRPEAQMLPPPPRRAAIRNTSNSMPAPQRPLLLTARIRPIRSRI